MENAEYWSSIGTPLYMSPQVFEETKFSSKCDIWSLGILLYELLYGNTPWYASSPINLLKKIQNEPLEFPVKPLRSKIIKELISMMLVNEEKGRINWPRIFEHDLVKLDKVFLFSLYISFFIIFLRIKSLN